jgi:Domain of unknown function (DUF4391)
MESETRFLESLPVAAQPWVHLCAVYQGWIDRVEEIQAARLTGRFVVATTLDAAAARRAALDDHDRIQKEITSMRARAAKETQIRHRVELNLVIRRLESERAVVKRYL